jgi:hypothetical protein
MLHRVTTIFQIDFARMSAKGNRRGYLQTAYRRRDYGFARLIGKAFSVLADA